MSVRHTVAEELAMAEPPVRKRRPARGKRPEGAMPDRAEAAQRRKFSALLEETRRQGEEVSTILRRLEERFL